MSLIIHLSQKEVTYQGEGRTSNSDPVLDITVDLYNKEKQPTVEIQDSKYIFQLYQNDVQLGYCYSINYGLDVIRNLVAQKVQPNVEYQLEVSADCLNVKFCQLQAGYLYGKKVTLLDEFKLSKLPKLEVNRLYLSESENESDNESSDSDESNESQQLVTVEPEPKQPTELIGEEVALEEVESENENKNENDNESSESGQSEDENDESDDSSESGESEDKNDESDDSSESDESSDESANNDEESDDSHESSDPDYEPSQSSDNDSGESNSGESNSGESNSGESSSDESGSESETSELEIVHHHPLQPSSSSEDSE